MLNSLHIKNFRCFEDLTIAELGQVNLIVGRNNTGKSTLLEAISIFVMGKDDDFHFFFGDAGESLMDHIRALLEKRNEFFLSKEKVSDVDIFSKMVFKENPHVYFGESDKKKSKPYLAISIGKSEQGNYVFCFNNKISHSCRNLDKNYNIDRSDFKKNQEDYFSREKKEQEENTIESNDASFSNILKKIKITKYDLKYWSLYNKKYQLIPSHLVSEDKLAILWDGIYHRNKDSEILDVLKIILPNISSLHFSMNPQTNKRAAFFKEKNDQEARPLKAMGEGTTHLLQIFIYAFLAKNSYLMIDEIENGLHYSIHQQVWEKLFSLAKKLNIQLFVTTHSKDILETFAKVAVKNKAVDGQLISLGRSVAKSNRDQIIADSYSEDRLDWIINSGMEVR